MKRILFGRRDVTELPPDRHNAAWVFQFPVICDATTIYNTLAFRLRNRRDARRAQHSPHTRRRIVS